MLERYEAALLRLPEAERELVIARVEMGYTNEELANLFGKPTKGAARVAVGRALVRLAEEMGHDA
jgi:RNA polymerase sigma-70 factor (ECF subfamily)